MITRQDAIMLTVGGLMGMALAVASWLFVDIAFGARIF